MSVRMKVSGEKRTKEANADLLACLRPPPPVLRMKGEASASLDRVYCISLDMEVGSSTSKSRRRPEDGGGEGDGRCDGDVMRWRTRRGRLKIEVED